jgi:hypothetical protein
VVGGARGAIVAGLCAGMWGRGSMFNGKVVNNMCMEAGARANVGAAERWGEVGIGTVA